MRLVSAFLLFSSAAAFGLTLELKPGTEISTLSAARDAVRRARAGGETGQIVVRVAEGIYPLSEPVVFEPQDSNVMRSRSASQNDPASRA